MLQHRTHRMHRMVPQIKKTNHSISRNEPLPFLLPPPPPPHLPEHLSAIITLDCQDRR
ncbi:hypothetical protein DENSPDRAFT_845651 [Dentipellis sp. KUC8613]|nr:hypothetical protein DENSPDRAFT_845651 [Dentipellis sp. KUC8613]